VFVYHFLHILRLRVVQLRSPFCWDLVPHDRVIGAWHLGTTTLS